MRFATLATSLLLAALPVVRAQSSSTTPAPSTTRSERTSRSSTSDSDTASFTFPSGVSVSTVTDGSVSVPTGSYQSYSRQITVSSSSSSAPSNSSRNATMTSSSSSNTLLITGSSRSNATSTSTSAAPSNTQACNNYPELCSRRYMNFTEVVAHNAPFVKPNNAASNQMYGILSQLNDGVRMIQHETHWYQEDLYACHTSCDLLNAGTLQQQLLTVRQWIQKNPYDVVTILLVNSDFRNVTDFVAPIQNAGLEEYLYVPPKIPMRAEDWPTLSTMILSGKRVVLFLDYQANQTQVPYVLDEFSQMWETPFSPTNISFPCTQQRPPNLSSDLQNNLPYLANHNLNVKLSFAGMDLLIPNFADLDQVNSISGVNGNNKTGSLGAMTQDCMQRWDRPPAWLLVDFYNYGTYNGSVFETAANLNGLNYRRRNSCCGMNDSLSAAPAVRAPFILAAAMALASVMFYWAF